MTRGRKNGTSPYEPVLRWLGPDEPIPQGEGHRYPASSGYVRLRWTVAVGETVEALEHRVVMERHLGRRLRPDEHVHHVNHDRADNRLENLQVVTRAEHGAEHRRLDHEHIGRLYEGGMSTPEVARVVGCDHAVVYRALLGLGIRPRSISESLRVDVDIAALKELHRSGDSQRTIARKLGISANVVRRVFQEEGLKANPPGRQPKRVTA